MRKRNRTTWTAEPVETRFARKYRALPNGCWEWTGVIQKGYGWFKLADGRQVRAHRLSYQLHKGLIPEGMLVLHSCDFRACVNPAHLSLGTHLRNMREAVERGRMPRGELNQNSKLTTAQVRAIRAANPVGRAAIDGTASQFGCSPATICFVLCRYTWADVE